MRSRSRTRPSASTSSARAPGGGGVRGEKPAGGGPVAASKLGPVVEVGLAEDVVGPRRAEMVVARVWVARVHGVAGQRSRVLVRRVYRLRRAEAALLEARLLRHHPALLHC